ncbi:MAG: GNAT family N-acetyltransferase [Oscillospiraceae bacterium]|jgi:GNAT superfamily N-acetyltransferase|nr:GNAT family N-acetyltransferase [Oscillospiraceae bacterium]
MQIRPANANDIPALVELRKRQLADEGEGPPPDHHLIKYFTAAMADGSLAAWVTEAQGVIIATGAVCFYALPPTYRNPTGRTAYVTNMYTRDEYRRRGIATEFLHMAIEEAKARGCGIIRLHASEDGRPIYRKAGFVDSDGYMAMMI